jgi:hypothetical protein
MSTLFCIWFVVSVACAIAGFVNMVGSMNTAERWNASWESDIRAKHQNTARKSMWVSLLAPLWPALILVLPSLLIKWVVSQYRQVFKMEVVK